MSFGEVDTLNMLFDKLQSLFDESQGYYESFLDTNNMYKKGQLSDKEFFQKLGDYTVAYSALEFLLSKVIFEMRKSLGSGSLHYTISWVWCLVWDNLEWWQAECQAKCHQEPENCR